MPFHATEEKTFKITCVGPTERTHRDNMFIECASDRGVVAFWGSLHSWENLVAIQARQTPFEVRCGCRAPMDNFPRHQYWVPETASIHFL